MSKTINHAELENVGGGYWGGPGWGGGGWRGYPGYGGGYGYNPYAAARHAAWQYRRAQAAWYGGGYGGPGPYGYYGY